MEVVRLGEEEDGVGRRAASLQSLSSLSLSPGKAHVSPRQPNLSLLSLFSTRERKPTFVSVSSLSQSANEAVLARAQPRAMRPSAPTLLNGCRPPSSRPRSKPSLSRVRPTAGNADYACFICSVRAFLCLGSLRCARGRRGLETFPLPHSPLLDFSPSNAARRRNTQRRNEARRRPPPGAR